MTIRICPRCNQEFNAKPPQKKLCPECSETYDPASLKRLRENQRRINAGSKCQICGQIKTPISRVCWSCYAKMSRAEKRQFNQRAYPDKIIKRQGYIELWMPDYYRATKQGYVREHILVWEKANKKRLPEGYIVHHLNAIKGDNRIENLVAIKRKDHDTGTFIKALQTRIRELEQMTLPF